MKAIAIIVAAGKSERAGVDKIWVKSNGVTMLEKAARPFFDSKMIDSIIFVVAKTRKREAEKLFEKEEKAYYVVEGGETRSQSVKNAMRLAKDLAKNDSTIVAIHDGARPYVTQALIEKCLDVAREHGSGIPVIPVTDSLRKITSKGNIAVSREEFVSVQTPQCFLLEQLVKAYDNNDEATDDATLYEKYCGQVTLVDGDEKNIKITYLSDIYKDISARVGIGFDVHPLVQNRPLILGGIRIPFEKGLVGHSDADVLTHAIMDAILTAANLPDIGHLFPPDDDKYEGANSICLLEEVIQRISKKGLFVVNVSATVMAEKPKIAPFIPAMEKKIADTIGVNESNVSFAATTTEKLGIVGEGKGMAAEAIALLGGKDTCLNTSCVLK